MKRILLSVAAFATLSMSVNAQQRTVLYEEFTGENCGPCAAANPGLETLMATNSTKIIHVTYMENIPVHTPHIFYKSDSVLFDARMAYYNTYWSSLGFEFTPSGMMDGFMPDTMGTSCGNVANFTQTDITNEYAKPSPFSITATHYFNTAHDSVFGKVIVKAVSAIGGAQLKLKAVYVKSLNFATAPGTNGETHFENVARVMLPSTAGQSLPTSWAVGFSDTLTYKGKITGYEATLTGVTTADSSFVIWVQNDSTGYKVLQAAKSVYTVPSSSAIQEVTGTMANIQIAPNPAANYIHVEGTLAAPAPTKITITNAVGQTVTEKGYPVGSTLFSENISLNNFSNGIYFMNIANNGTSVTKKFVIAK